MKKYLFIVLLAGVCFGQEVKEKYNEKYLNAFGYSSDKNIYLSAVSSRLGIRFEPFFGFNVSGQNTDEKETEIDTESKLTITRIGAGIFQELLSDEENRIFTYLGLRFTRTENIISLKQSDPLNLSETLEADTSSINLSYAPVIGSHVYVNDRISIGGEIQLNIAQDEEISVNEDINGDSDKITFYQYDLSTKIFIRVYF